MRARLLLMGALLCLGCAHGGEPDIATLASNSDQVIWEAGQKALEARQWESARKYFRRITDGFPQSQYAPAARLALADAYFQEGGTANDILAVSAYREFLTFYPSHPRSAYAQFQVAESFFRQRHGPDRDQTSTEQALGEYQKLLELHPGSPHVETAKARIALSRQSLARADFLAGFFYQRTRRAYRAAIARYEGVLSDYPDYQRLDEVLFRIAECLNLSGRGAEALPHIARLLQEFPTSIHAESARRLMAELSASPPRTSPSPSPAPTPQASPVGP